jgi:adenylate cyclase
MDFPMRYILLILFLGLSGLAFSQTIQELETDLRQSTDVNTKIILNYQLAEAYLKKRDYRKAQNYGRSSHDLAVESSKYGLATKAAFLLGDINLRDRNMRNADVWFGSAFELAKQANDPDLIIKSVAERSKIAKKDRNYRRAYEIIQEAFDYFSQRGKSISELEQQYEIQRAELAKEKKALTEEIENLSSDRDRLSTQKNQLEKQQEKLVREKEQVEEGLSAKEEELATVAEEKEKVEERAKEVEKQVSRLTKEQAIKEAALAKAQTELEQEKRVKAELELQAANRRNLIIILISLSLLVGAISFSLYLRYRAKKKSSDIMAEKNKIIEAERQRSDELLLNILPKDIAQELKEKGEADAQRFENVSVLFTDFKDFSRISERLSPEQLVHELDYCFRAFDNIISQYKSIEKIKTIGDAYMCANGLTQRRTLPMEIVQAAVDMQEFMEDYKRQKISRGEPFFEARIGIHTGPVVAGVVGNKKFAYDIWGSTVNVAARMESKCDPGKVNISDSTYRQVKYKFNCVPRGRIEAKNIGFIEMFYVNN